MGWEESEKGWGPEQTQQGEDVNAKKLEELKRMIEQENKKMRQIYEQKKFGNPPPPLGGACLTKQGQVQNELNKLESAISRLEEIVSVVGQKFNFVMRPDYPQDCGTEKEQQVDVELGQVIQMYHNRINNMTNRLQVFIDRCEL